MEVHIYECGGCEVGFSVSAEYEEQDVVGCPICKKDERVRAVGYGVVTVLQEGEEQDEKLKEHL